MPKPPDLTPNETKQETTARKLLGWGYKLAGIRLLNDRPVYVFQDDLSFDEVAADGLARLYPPLRDEQRGAAQATLNVAVTVARKEAAAERVQDALADAHSSLSTARMMGNDTYHRAAQDAATQGDCAAIRQLGSDAAEWIAATKHRADETARYAEYLEALGSR